MANDPTMNPEVHRPNLSDIHDATRRPRIPGKPTHFIEPVASAGVIFKTMTNSVAIYISSPTPPV